MRTIHSQRLIELGRARVTVYVDGMQDQTDTGRYLETSEGAR